MSERLLVLLQFWEGDKALAMRLARLLADLEPAFNKDVDFMFCARFDCTHDSDTMNYVSKKFGVFKYTCRRRATGWPYGCNELVHDLWAELLRASEAPSFNYSAAYFLEADNVPLRKDWAAALMEEWAEARAKGLMILGAWSPDHSEYGHVNGNMIFRPDLSRHVKGLEGCAPNVAWDVAHTFRYHHLWHKSQLIKNMYKVRNISEEELYAPVSPGGPVPAVVHGIKDDSAWKIISEKLLGPV